MEGDSSELTEEKPKSKPFTRVFLRDLPYFLSIGMSREEYWYEDPLLVRDYLQAEEYRRKNENYTLWLGGIYMREAIMSSIGNAFIDKGGTPYEYMDKPLPMGSEEIEAAKEAAEEREVQQAEMYMKLLVERGKDWGKKEPIATEI